MDIDLRRLGMGAQLQIALALVGRGAERRDNHAPEDRGQVPARPQKEGK